MTSDSRTSDSLKSRMASGGKALGGWVNSTDPLIAEIFAGFGCDFLFIDTEHEPIGRRDLMGILMACKGTGCAPLVRVPGNNAEDMKWVMDLGADGIVVPQISGAEDARRAVSHVRYAPLGERGCGAMRAADFGRNSRYYEQANDRLMLLLQAETRGFIDELDEILLIEGYDGVFVGPMDLSQSLGHLGNPGHPEVQSVMERVIRKASMAGKVVAMAALEAADIELRLKQGARMFIVGTDYRFIREGISSRLAAFRPLLGA